MTKIRFNERASKFFDIFRRELCIDDLHNGTKQTIFLGYGGYKFDPQVIKIEFDGFTCKVQNKDLTRFPARIKSCATYLAEIRAYGRYQVSHH